MLYMSKITVGISRTKLHCIMNTTLILNQPNCVYLMFENSDPSCLAFVCARRIMILEQRSSQQIVVETINSTLPDIQKFKFIDWWSHGSELFCAQFFVTSTDNSRERTSIDRIRSLRKLGSNYVFYWETLSRNLKLYRFTHNYNHFWLFTRIPRKNCVPPRMNHAHRPFLKTSSPHRKVPALNPAQTLININTKRFMLHKFVDRFELLSHKIIT